jgi:hypothetical protein
VSPLAIRRLTCRLRRHAAALLVVLALGGLVAVHHSAIAMDHMHHDGMAAVIELCVGVVTALGAGVAAIAVRRRSPRGWPRPKQLATVGVLNVATRTTPDPRAGPASLPLLCAWRR